MTKIAKKLFVTAALLFSTALTACGGGNKGEEKSGGGETGGDPVVTFRLNYKTGEADIFKTVTVKKGECVEEPEEAPEREGYIFDGWHDKFDADSEFDFDDEITKSIKIFAHWLAKLECTFDLNYDGAPAATKVQVIQRSAVARPEDPTREGYQFIGWTINKEEKAGDDKFEYYDFERLFTENRTLYAQWGAPGSAKAYRFEAEFSNVITKGMGMTGNTYSGATTGLGLIGKETDNNSFGCSNGFYVHHLYATGNNLKFEINSSAAGTAKIQMRLSAEYYGFKMNSVGLVNEDDPSDKETNIAKYPIIVNGNSIDYGTIEFTNVPRQGQGDKPFDTYLLTESVALVEGKNTIEMKTDNKLQLQGTAIACAPMIDCLTFETSCSLSWMNANGMQAYKAPTNN